ARPGIMLYGASPFPDETAKGLGLKPVMTLSSRIIAVQDVEKGEGVGYGPIFRAERNMRIGIVACGYADGYPRHAPNGTPVLVGNSRTRTVGRVSMDMLFVDIDDIQDAGVGTEVVLWGEGLPVEEVAKCCGTISYELLCALAPRVPVTCT
ncbi:MAG TPA: alanine racemase, partial [Burkholderiales bacterium]|nr:alanine racemase [Burkholderiales bacterium]